MGLLDVADGSRNGSFEEEKRLKRAILRWVGDDERITMSMRTKMGKASVGSDAYEHTLRTKYQRPSCYEYYMYLRILELLVS